MAHAVIVNEVNETVMRFEERQRTAAAIKENNPFLSRFEAMYLGTFRRPEDREQEFRNLLAERERLREEGQEFRLAYDAVTQDFNATWAALEMQMQQLIDLLHRQREHFNQRLENEPEVPAPEQGPPTAAEQAMRMRVENGMQAMLEAFDEEMDMDLLDLSDISRCQYCRSWYAVSYINTHQATRCPRRPQEAPRRSARIRARKSQQK